MGWGGPRRSGAPLPALKDSFDETQLFAQAQRACKSIQAAHMHTQQLPITPPQVGELRHCSKYTQPLRSCAPTCNTLLTPLCMTWPLAFRRYINGRVHEKYNSTLYEIHWVWTGGSPECKLQNIRDAGRFLDPPEYYGKCSVCLHCSSYA